MARPKPDLPDPAQIQQLIDSEGRLCVRVTPGARSESVAVEDGRLLVKTRAKPQDGAANAAVIRLVAAVLNRAPSRIVLVKGATSRDKLLKISD